jgi:moderate conductance mechanosensitive channel
MEGWTVETLHAWLPELKTALRIFLVLTVAWVLKFALSRLLRRLRILFVSRAKVAEDIRWIETIMRALRYTLSIVIFLAALMMVLNELGISIAPILGAAGVVGVAVGFGAQSLIKDYFNGFFLLLENQVRVGDVVEIAGKSGLVEEVSLRRTRLRGYDGNVHYIANGLITTVTNMSTGFAYAVMDIGIAYKENVDRAIAVLHEVGRELRADAAHEKRILDDLDVAGVDSLADSAVMIRCRMKVLPLEQWTIRRDFLRRVKARFDLEGIEIPFPHRTIYFGQPSSGAQAGEDLPRPDQWGGEKGVAVAAVGTSRPAVSPSGQHGQG